MHILSCTCSTWLVKLHWLDHLMLYKVPDWNSMLFWYLCYLLPVEIWEPGWNPVHFLLTDIIKRGQSRDNFMILLFHSNISVDGLIWFLCRINTLLIQCLNLMLMCIQCNTWDCSDNRAFIKLVKPHAHVFYIQRHCTNSVIISD